MQFSTGDLGYNYLDLDSFLASFARFSLGPVCYLGFALRVLVICQYYCKRLTGKSRLQNDLWCVVGKRQTILTHSRLLAGWLKNWTNFHDIFWVDSS